MQIHFERLTDCLYIRHEVFAVAVRSVFAHSPGDLSVQIDDDYLRLVSPARCPLCLANQEHTTLLHRRLLQGQATANRMHTVLAGLPWPVAK